MTWIICAGLLFAAVAIGIFPVGVFYQCVFETLFRDEYWEPSLTERRWIYGAGIVTMLALFAAIAETSPPPRPRNHARSLIVVPDKAPPAAVPMMPPI